MKVAIEEKDEKKLTVHLKKIITKYARAECLSKGLFVFKAFRELIGYQEHSKRSSDDFKLLVDAMLTDSRHIDYYLRELKERKKFL